jgi:hypothetical protein
MAEATRVHDRWAPGLVGDIPAPHARHYAASQAFEREVAAESGALMARFDPRRDFLRTAEGGGGFLGSVAVDGGAETAQFRFFIPAPALRGGRSWAAVGSARRWRTRAARASAGCSSGRSAAWTPRRRSTRRPASCWRMKAPRRSTGTPALERRFGLAL